TFRYNPGIIPSSAADLSRRNSSLFGPAGSLFAVFPQPSILPWYTSFAHPQNLYPLEPGNLWDRNRGIRFGDEETKLQYNRFKSYLALPPPRRYTTIAAIEKVTVGYIAN
ncbi:MAG: hypothetical protein ACK56F_30410, partial [bacterium]